MSENAGPAPGMECTLLGRSAGMPVVGGIVAPEKDLPGPGEGAGPVGVVNTEGEKAAEVAWDCVRLADGDVLEWPSSSSWSPESSGAFLRFLREWDSLSDLSNTTLAILSNSPQRLSMRLMLPLDSSDTRVERKLTTTLISLTSDRARASVGFCSMLAKSVTRAETG